YGRGDIRGRARQRRTALLRLKAKQIEHLAVARAELPGVRLGVNDVEALQAERGRNVGEQAGRILRDHANAKPIPRAGHHPDARRGGCHTVRRVTVCRPASHLPAVSPRAVAAAWAEAVRGRSTSAPARFRSKAKGLRASRRRALRDTPPPRRSLVRGRAVTAS